MTTDAVPGTRAATALILLVPFGAAIALFQLLETWRDVLPDPVAVHWGPTLEPNGFLSLSQLGWLSLLPLLGALAGGLILFASGRHASHRSAAVAIATGLSGFIVGLEVLLIGGQRGLPAGASAASPTDAAMAAVVLGSVLLAVLAAWVTPRPAEETRLAQNPVPASAPRMDLAPGEKAAWAGWSSSGRVLAILVGVVAGALLPVAALSGMWWTVGATALVSVSAVLALFSFRVTAGEAGLVARGVIGWPVFRVPLEQLAYAEVVQVNPLTDFGGWGYRLGAGGVTGIVVRKGEALKVVRADSSSLVITLDGAQQAAALLNTLADRARPQPRERLR
ncbi:MAG: hypothetical protein ACK5MT_01630 [Actinomycetales bacterium]